MDLLQCARSGPVITGKKPGPLFRGPVSIFRSQVMSVDLFGFDPPTKELFWGNFLLVVCCAFYLAWWLLAFKPVGAIKGFVTGWLLLPAAAAGVAAVVLLVRGIGAARVEKVLFPNSWVLWGGIAAYVILLAATLLLWKRPVTTELFLIVGWAALSLVEVNTLFGTGRLSHRAAVGFLAVIAAATVVSLVCYVLYYNLDSRAGYIDGMVPLLLAALVMAALSIGMAVA